MQVLPQSPARLLKGPPAGWAVALLFLTLVAYWPATHAGFIWDDNDYVTANPTLRDAAGLARIWTDTHANWQYYPLVFTTFWLEYHAWGLSPLGYHLDNILIHAASAIVLWRLLLRLEFAPTVAWLAAAIFAVHPVEVESVAWVTERKNVLCGLFYLSAMLIWFNARPSKWSYLGSLALFTCAMFSKTVAATWPAALLVILWWRSGRVRLRDVINMIPFFAIGAALGLLTTSLESGQVGAGTGGIHDWDFTFADRCAIAGRALWFYAGKAILPVDLSFIYPRWTMKSIWPPIAAVAMLIILGQTRRIGRGPLAAALLFMITLTPALGFVDYYPMRYSFVADHFQYLAIIALIVPIAILANRCGVALFVVLLLLVATFVQCTNYMDPVTLWSDTVQKNPASWMAHVNLGQAWDAEHRPDLAEPQYKTATDCAPDEPDTWWKLGEFHASRRHYPQAEAEFRRALQVDPEYEPAQRDLARVLAIESRN